MGVIQASFYVPPEIEAGISNGTLKTANLVIRGVKGKHAGKVVKQLPQVAQKASQEAKSLSGRMVTLVRTNPKATVAWGLGAAAVASGAGIYHWLSHRRQKVIKVFNGALSTYLDNIRHGELQLSDIDNLLKAIDAISSDKNSSKGKVALPVDELAVLVQTIRNYTIDLAKRNAVTVTDIDEDSGEQPSNVIDLQKYLKAQKKIFEQAS